VNGPASSNVFERIERGDVQRLVRAGAQLVEVLPRAEYDYEHIADAHHIWLRTLDEQAPRRLDRTRPVIVYCHDYLCDMSPRAARRLDHLGFAQIYDYVPGKVDWLAAGLPREGVASATPNPGELARRDLPTSNIRAGAEQALALMRRAGQPFCVVVDDDVVMGMAYRDELEDALGANAVPDRRVEELMHPGPTTVRANEPLQPLLGRMERAGVDGILVTDPEGRLIGLLDRRDAASTLAGQE
jgi:CBS domain-containing protein/rhodanese-related sulfurtransferase